MSCGEDSSHREEQESPEPAQSHSGKADFLETAPDYRDRFAHRFTSSDKEYQDYLKRASNIPPIVEDWRVRRGGQNWGRDNRSLGQGWSGDQRQDRSWKQGSRHHYPQSGYRNSYNQGYNSYS